MNHLFVSTPSDAGTEQTERDDTRLHGRWLIVARITWIVVAVLAMGIFIASIPAYYVYILRFLCTTASCTDIGKRYIQELHAFGISAEFYAIYSVVVTSIFALGYFAVGLLLFWRTWGKSHDRMALLASFFLVTFVIAFNGTTLATVLPAWQWLIRFESFLGSLSIFFFFYLFPNGRFIPRWTGWLLVAAVIYWGAITFFPYPSFNPFLHPVVNTIMFVGLVSSMIVVQVYRYRRISNVIEKQQTKWVVFGLSLAISGFLGLNVPFQRFALRLPYVLLIDLIVVTVIILFMLLIPLSIGFAILRSRLWEIDIIINRTLVYGALTASIVGLYVLVVGGLGIVFQTRGNFFISLLVTGLVAVFFQPLRNRLQQAVNRLVYGERDDPYAVLSRLAQRLEATLAPETVLPTIVETVAQALKIPYVAITLKQDDTFITAASYGVSGGSQDSFIRLPLVYQTEHVGELVLAPRAPGEKFTPADQRLLHDLAYEIGVAVHAIRLTTDLQRLTIDLQHSRERLVLAREEERRRLRRDLHDGIGPTLASLFQRLDTACRLVPHDPDAAVLLLDSLKGQVKATIAEIRHVVYALRPPVLDELGLISALREHTGYAQESNGLRIVIEAPEAMPPLPAAVEVAAYRIILEALTNVERHAYAHTCLVRLDLTEAGALCLDITDDGCGLSAHSTAGVGLTSMRERAAELGGACKITAGPTGGTRVWVRFPLAKE